MSTTLEEYSNFDGFMTRKIERAKNSASFELTVKTASLEQFKDWVIGGRGRKRNDCGTYRASEMCNDTKKLWIKRNWCMKRECPVCYPIWASKAGARITERLRGYQHHRRAGLMYHWTISFSQWANFQINNVLAREEPERCFQLLLKKAYRILYKEFTGGAVVFHPYRYDKEESHQWYFSPHFHIITDDRFKNTEELYEKYEKRYIFKRIRPLLHEGIERVASYELSHAGWESKKNAHVVKYFGACSYNKFKTQEIKLETYVACVCQDCKKKQPPDRGVRRGVEAKLLLEVKSYSPGSFYSKVIIHKQKELSLLRREQKFIMPMFTDKSEAIQYVKDNFPRIMLKDFLEQLDFIEYKNKQKKLPVNDRCPPADPIQLDFVLS